MARSRSTPRSLLTGSVSFGLVNVPVRVYSAVHEHKLRFQLLHAKDDGPIGYDKVCKLRGRAQNSQLAQLFEVHLPQAVREPSMIELVTEIRDLLRERLPAA